MIDIDKIHEMEWWRILFLFIYIIPIFGLPIYAIYDLLDATASPLANLLGCCKYKRISLMFTTDPEYLCILKNEQAKK